MPRPRWKRIDNSSKTWVKVGEGKFLPFEGKLSEVEGPWKAELARKRREIEEKRKTACPCTRHYNEIVAFRTPEECRRCQEITRYYGSWENYDRQIRIESERAQEASKREYGLSCLCECCMEDLAENCVLTWEPGVTRLYQAAIDPKCKLSTLKKLIEYYDFDVNGVYRHFSYKNHEYVYCSLLQRMREKCKRPDLLEYVEELAKKPKLDKEVEEWAESLMMK